MQIKKASAKASPKCFHVHLIKLAIFFATALEFLLFVAIAALIMREVVRGD